MPRRAERGNRRALVSALDKAAKRGVIHKNVANRRKARLNKAAAKAPAVLIFLVLVIFARIASICEDEDEHEQEERKTRLHLAQNS